VIWIFAALADRLRHRCACGSIPPPADLTVAAVERHPDVAVNERICMRSTAFRSCAPPGLVRDSNVALL